MKSPPMDINEDFIEKLEALISEEMVRHKIPGTSVAIIKKDKIIYQQGFGTRDLEGNLPVTPTTFFNIASVTKSVICLGILKLEESGKLDRHDPISKYLPCKLGYEDDPITIHHLMNHTSGIPEIIAGIGRQDLAMEEGIDIPFIPFTTWDDFFRHVNGATEYVTEKPGRRLYYQNHGYTMLGRIIEIVSGKSLTDFIKTQILHPLEMKNSTFLKEDLDKLEELSLAYKTKKSKVVKTKNFTENRIFGYAAGGLFSSVVELANLLIMYLHHGTFKGVEIIGSDLIDAMFTMSFEETQNSKLYTPTIGDFGKTGYGYGLAIHENFFGYKLVHHSGSWIGASAWFAMLPDLEIGVVILSNKHPSPRMLALAILGMLIDIDVKKEFPLLKYRHHIEKLAGEYELYKGVGKMKLIIKEGLLHYQFDYWAINTPLLPYDDNPMAYNYYILTEVGEKDPVEFELGKAGTIWMHHERLKWKKVRDYERPS